MSLQTVLLTKERAKAAIAGARPAWRSDPKVNERAAVGVLEAKPPAFSESDARRLAREVFGIVATLQPLESERDRATLEPAADEARAVVDRMRDEGVLIGLEGPLGNVLKIRPPMVFTEADADRLVETLDRVLVGRGGT